MILLLVNLLVAVAGLGLGWTLTDLLWPYWLQSVVIGWFARQRILALKRFSVTGLMVNGARVDESVKTQKDMALFFVLHYGGFHLAYLVVLSLDWAPQEPSTLLMALAAGVAFTFQQSRAHRHTVETLVAGRPGLGMLIVLPYLRIVPMHATLLLGATQAGDAGGFWLVLFTLLKTLADIGMEKLEDRILARSAVKGAAMPPAPATLVPARDGRTATTSRSPPG